MDPNQNQSISSAQPIIPPTSNPVANNASNHMSTKTIVVVLLLVFLYPVGAILMWFWTNWPKWLKIILSLPVILLAFGIITAFFLASSNPAKQIQQAKQHECIAECSNNPQNTICINACMQTFDTPTPRKLLNN